jgi:hypothetical protein
MKTRGSYLKFIMFGSNKWKVTSITPSMGEFLHVQCSTVAGLHSIRCSISRSAYPPEKQYQPFPKGTRGLKNGYYILNIKNMRCSFQQSTKTCMVGLIVVTGSLGLSNRQICCTLYLLEPLLDRHIGCERMLHQEGSTVYGL